MTCLTSLYSWFFLKLRIWIKKSDHELFIFIIFALFLSNLTWYLMYMNWIFSFLYQNLSFLVIKNGIYIKYCDLYSGKKSWIRCRGDESFICRARNKVFFFMLMSKTITLLLYNISIHFDWALLRISEFINNFVNTVSNTYNRNICNLFYKLSFL